MRVTWLEDATDANEESTDQMPTSKQRRAGTMMPKWSRTRTVESSQWRLKEQRMRDTTPQVDILEDIRKLVLVPKCLYQGTRIK
ncbi:hypothetical protein NDU88_005159 [Pleurodeles waltl]|uniref:Uncharacterized protein n=1 Tax=Pleurodeles waltl TaxID=8319 RepID=A0AAV7WUE6_PLEWA|nr:hypothetical protein NDU88_005159 [Pleurodeles waltl]